MDIRDDDGYTTSDAELDSETEDNIEDDLEKDLGEWLDQLSSPTHSDVPPPKPPLTNRRPKLTQKDVMDSFRYSVLEGGEGQDIDLDAILGDLCELEATINAEQTEFSESKNAPKQEKNCSKPGPRTSESYNDLDRQLQSALSVLNDLTTGDPVSPSNDLDPMKVLNDTLSDNASLLANNSSITTQHGNSGKTVKFCDESYSETTQIKDTNFNNTSKSYTSRHGDPAYPVTSPKPSIVRTSFGDTSPVSVPTVTSQFSTPHTVTTSQLDRDNLTGHQVMVQRLNSLEQQMSKQNLSTEEQAMKIKEEKMKIALEKIKDANIKKLFVRAYSDDGCSKSILVDEKMTVSQVINTLVAKNHVSPHLNWTLVEIMPDLNMERMLEDHSSLVEQMLMWTRDSSNRILFTERPQKYDMFRSPEAYLTSVDEMDLDMSLDRKQALIKDMFNEDTHQVPEVDGVLYVKSEGKKAWKKYYCVLRSSGIYFNPKGKAKSSRDLQCIQKLDFVDVYSGAGWQKKFKAPTEFCFALKHPQIQKKTSKYIRYMCAENLSSMARWIAGIRIAKYGYHLYRNYLDSDNAVRNWGKTEVDTNPNFPEYIAKQAEITQHFIRQSSYHLIKRHSTDTGRGSIDQSSNGSNRFSVNSVQSGSSSNSSDIEVERLRSQTMQNHSRTGSYSSQQTDTSHSTDGSLQNYTITLMDTDSPQESSTDEGFIETNSVVPTKMIPNIPVTTNTTKYLTEVNSGTLRRSPKKSVSVHGTNSLRRKSGTLSRRRPSTETDEILKVEITELPPPPPEMLMDNSEVRRESFNNGDVRRESLNNGELRRESFNNGEVRRESFNNCDVRRETFNAGEMRKESFNNGDVRRTSFENNSIRRVSFENNGPRKLSSAEQVIVVTEEPHYDEVPVERPSVNHTYQTISSVYNNSVGETIPADDSHQYSNIYDQPLPRPPTVNVPPVSERPLPSPPRPAVPPPTPPKKKKVPTATLR